MPESTVHSDVFVSYRRLNVDFVKGFVDAIKEAGKEVWIDWEDIPPGSESFTDDIKRGIEGSSTFIAILSPEYLDSTYTVDLELGYAVELNKRIIPVVYRKFEDYTAPASVSHINWIYFTPHAGQENNFDEGIARVVEAMDVDFDYIRDHTRLLQRAREWDVADRQASYLLTGAEIHTAEAWLAQSANKEPNASKIHHEFIQASRLHDNQVTRRNLSIAVFVTILSIVLAGFALVQWQNAVEQQAIAEEQRAIAVLERDRAEQQQRLSDSRRLSVQSFVASNVGEVDASLLLSLEAIQSANTADAIGGLVSTFEGNPYLQTYLYDHPDTLSAVASHPFDAIAVTGSDEGSLAVWDMDALELQYELFADDNDIWDIVFHPNGDYFVVGTEDGSMQVYDTESGDELAYIDDVHQGTITSLAYHPDGSLLLSTSYDGNAILWDSETLLDGDPQFSILTNGDSETTHTDWILDSTWNPDGTQLAIITWDNVLQIWEAESVELVFEPIQLALGASNFSISGVWSPDGRYILMGDVLGNIRFIDASSGQLLDFQLSRHTDHVREIVYHPSGEFFSSVSHDGAIILWDANSGQRITESSIFVHGNQVRDLAFSPDGLQMLSVGDDGHVVVFDMTRPHLLGKHILTHESEIYEVMYTDDSIISVGLDGNVYETDTSTHESVVLFTPEIGRFTAADLSPDETTLALATDTGFVQLFDMQSFEPLGDGIIAHAASIFSIEFSPDGTWLATSGDDTWVRIWQVQSLKQNAMSNYEFQSHSDGVLDVTWHPTEPILASASRDTTIHLTRLSDDLSGEVVAVLDDHEDDVETIVFSPDGSLLVSGGRDDTIVIWYVEDTLTGNPQSELLGSHNDWVLSLAFSPDGQTLVSGSRDRSIVLWDMLSLQELGGTLTHHDSWVWSVVFSSDGQQIVSGGRDDRLVIWDVNQDNWKALACDISNRSLYDDEWMQYKPDVPYRETCLIEN